VFLAAGAATLCLLNRAQGSPAEAHRLHRIYLGLRLYMADYEALPPMATADALRKRPLYFAQVHQCAGYGTRVANGHATRGVSHDPPSVSACWMGRIGW
jgi:hypothetical protein